MPHLAFCSNCGSDDLRIGSRTSVGIEVTCYRCTKKTVLAGIMLGEVDFLAGAKMRVDAMVQRARERAQVSVVQQSKTSRS